jgi:hypothetical protein
MKIKFVCSDESVAKHFPPLPSSHIIPEWYKKMSLSSIEGKIETVEELQKFGTIKPKTVRGCIPVKDYIDSGYIIRCPADIMITPEKNGDINSCFWTSRSGSCDSHSHEQLPLKINGEKNHYIKIVQPWTIKTPVGYSCYFYQPEFFFNENIKFFPGVVDTDDFDIPVNFPAIVTSKDSFVLQAGDPLMVVFPFKREKWEHEISIEDKKRSAIEMFIENGYKKLFHKKKKFI